MCLQSMAVASGGAASWSEQVRSFQGDSASCDADPHDSLLHLFALLLLASTAATPSVAATEMLPDTSKKQSVMSTLR